ncbi:hypothetical protein BH24ACT7_BH24ACT7_22270 [soil metagenome]
MFDVILGAVLAGAIVRGWMRGFVRSAVGLVVVVVGTILALRLSGPMGSLVSGIAGTSPDTSRIIGGVVVFAACSIAGVMVAGMMRKVLDAMPGLPTLDRAAGAVAAGLAGVLVLTLLVSAVRVLPLGGVGDSVEESELATMLTDPDRLPQEALAVVGGDRVLAVALRLDDHFGQAVVGDPGRETILLDVPAGAHLVPSAGQADALFHLANRARSEAGAAPLARSAELDAVALQHATDMYTGGWLAHASPDGVWLGGRLAAASVPSTASSEVIGLGPSPASIVDEWEGAAPSAARLGRDDVTRMGVAAVAGPLGVLVVVAMTG